MAMIYIMRCDIHKVNTWPDGAMMQRGGNLVWVTINFY